MEWMEFLRGLEKKGIFEQVKRIRTSCRDIYDLAKVTGRVQHNPLEGLHKHLQSKKAENYAHVFLEELPPLLMAIRLTEPLIYPLPYSCFLCWGPLVRA